MNGNGVFIRHVECLNPDCGSSDALALYRQEDDSINGYCWSCKTHFSAASLQEERTLSNNSLYSRKEKTGENVVIDNFDELPYADLSHRGINQQTVELFGFKKGYNEQGEVDSYLIPFYEPDGSLYAVKQKFLSLNEKGKKKYKWHGKKGKVPLFGMHLSTSGKMVVITEGEEDTAAVKQMFMSKGKDYKVMSLPNGSHADSLKPWLEELDKYEHIVLCFDSDNPGQSAVKDAVGLLPPGKVKSMILPLKDANEMLLKGKTNEFWKCLTQAKSERPDGIISGAQTWSMIKDEPKITCIPYPFEALNKKTYGMRKGDLDTWTSGSGSGKTSVLKEIMYHILNTTNDNIGVMALEEPIADTVKSFMSLHLNKRIHLPDVRDQCTDEELYEAWQATMGKNRVHLYDHFGSVSEEGLYSKIRFLAKGLDCGYIFLDHLSIVVSGYAAQGGERERIDSIMTELKRLTQELHIYIALVVHLRKAENGKAFELGAIPSLDDLRGSGGIKQLSNGVYATARNQQAEDEYVRNTSSVHVLKCRFTGDTGPAGWVHYDSHTGRAYEVDNPYPAEDQPEEF